MHNSDRLSSGCGQDKIYERRSGPVQRRPQLRCCHDDQRGTTCFLQGVSTDCTDNINEGYKSFIKEGKGTSGCKQQLLWTERNQSCCFLCFPSLEVHAIFLAPGLLERGDVCHV